MYVMYGNQQQTWSKVGTKPKKTSWCTKHVVGSGWNEVQGPKTSMGLLSCWMNQSWNCLSLKLLDKGNNKCPYCLRCFRFQLLAIESMPRERLLPFTKLRHREGKSQVKLTCKEGKPGFKANLASERSLVLSHQLWYRCTDPSISLLCKWNSADLSTSRFKNELCCTVLAWIGRRYWCP